MKYYKIHINRTSKPMGNSTEGYTTYDIEEKDFQTLEEVTEYIKEYFPTKCKKEKMYRDTKDGTQEVGRIFCYKNSEYSNDNGKVNHYFNQDWVSISEIEENIVKDFNFNI